MSTISLGVSAASTRAVTTAALMCPPCPCQPSVSTVHRTGTYPARLASAMVRASLSPNGNRNNGAGFSPVTAVICWAPPMICCRTAASLSLVRYGWLIV